MITLERHLDRVIGVRASGSVVIVDRHETLTLARLKPGRSPRTLLPNHRIPIGDGRVRRVAPIVR